MFLTCLSRMVFFCFFSNLQTNTKATTKLYILKVSDNKLKDFLTGSSSSKTQAKAHREKSLQ